ncbi:Flp pilus assembly complex ATPase component TadA [Candidatus Micrarchaeota archaeon]|nr:Flp pilus assembly complex ATPase component TadA [Candidatus Micrarchaeota archaeon]MBU1930232.1 Flp pilus assembly complex ATPase component TadA [Candidatus Micrarchaeota archaeon]
MTDQGNTIPIIRAMIQKGASDESILKNLKELGVDAKTAQQLLSAGRREEKGLIRTVLTKPEIVIESYKNVVDGVDIEVDIIQRPGDFVLEYFLNFPEYGPGTRALLNNLKNTIISDATIRTEKMLDPKFIRALKEKFEGRASKILEQELPHVDNDTKKILITILLHEMLGLGKIEFLLADGNLEEIVVNSAREAIWVYNKKFGWLKTNIFIQPEEEIQNFASIIARRVGKQITTLNPLLDAHLITGDRANATLFPISSRGNTITIRRFRRDPWTVTDFIRNKTVNSEIMALVWLAMQYEMNILISGGTASGKTSILNVMLPFVQPNHRIISIEDTREIQLPEFLHWVPMTTREPSAEGKGGVEMLDLLVNSLRMRPDRLIVGEVRRQKEAEVMFEGMHTGHSVYTTFHANTSQETIRRLINPPVNVPATMLEAVHLNLVMFRNRRLGVRRVLQLSELVPEKRGADDVLHANVLYRWKPATDEIVKNADSIRFLDELSLHTGMNQQTMEKELDTKQKILDWMVKHNIHNVQLVGRIMAEYYMDEEKVVDWMQKDFVPDFLKESALVKPKEE